MDAIDRQERYLLGLAAKDIKTRYLVHILTGMDLHQFIIGVGRDNLTILWAPHIWRQIIGESLEDLDECGRVDLVEKI